MDNPDISFPSLSELDEPDALALDTALYRLGRLRSSEKDRELIAQMRQTYGRKQLADHLLTITGQNVFYPGDKVQYSGPHGLDEKVDTVSEIDCTGPYWEQQMPDSDGNILTERFSPAWSVIVKDSGGGHCFCARQSLVKASMLIGRE